MFNQFLNSFSGSLITSAYSYPTQGNVNVSPKSAFKNFFNNLMSSFGAQNQFGTIPGQGFSRPSGIPIDQGFGPNFGQFQNGQFPNQVSFRQRGNKRLRALSPGSVINNIAAPQNQTGGFTGPNQAGAFSPLQGFAGQTVGLANPGLNFLGGGFPAGPIQNQFALGAFPVQNNAPGGILPALISPIIGLFSIITSVLGIKKLINGFRPVEVDTTTQFDEYKSYLDEVYASRGSFDAVPEFNSESGSNFQEDFDLAKLQEY